MKILLFAVLLAVMQAAPSVPRKAPDKPAGSSHAVKKDSSDTQAPTTSPIVPNAVATKPDQSGGNPSPKTNEPESIVVRELPPVTIATEWWNRFYVMFTGLLVAIGIAGVWAAYRTLKVIEQQTKAVNDSVGVMRDQYIQMRLQTVMLRSSVQHAAKSADAAKKSAEATLESVKLQKVAMEQWIDTEEWNAAGSSYVPPTATEGRLSLSFQVANNTKFKLTLQTVDLWIDGQSLRREDYGEEVLAPEQYYIVETGFPLVGDNLVSYRDRFLEFEIGGLIRFRDAFNDQRELSFGKRCTCRQRGGDASFEPMFFRPPKDGESQKKGEKPS